MLRVTTASSSLPFPLVKPSLAGSGTQSPCSADQTQRWKREGVGGEEEGVEAVADEVATVASKASCSRRPLLGARKPAERAFGTHPAVATAQLLRTVTFSTCASATASWGRART